MRSPSIKLRISFWDYLGTRWFDTQFKLVGRLDLESIVSAEGGFHGTLSRKLIGGADARIRRTTATRENDRGGMGAGDLQGGSRCDCGPRTRHAFRRFGYCSQPAQRLD